MEANLFLAIKLQPDLIIRAMLQVALILRSKLKILLKRDTNINEVKRIKPKAGKHSLIPVVLKLFSMRRI